MLLNKSRSLSSGDFKCVFAGCRRITVALLPQMSISVTLKGHSDCRLQRVIPGVLRNLFTSSHAEELEVQFEQLQMVSPLGAEETGGVAGAPMVHQNETV